MGAQNTIGQIELIMLPEIAGQSVSARVDTGARTSAIWASKVRKSDEGLHVTFFGADEVSNEVFFEKYSQVVVVNSTGIAEKRYKVKILVVIKGRQIRAWFTLADRSKQTYPVLIGRNVLRGKFVVDVSIKKVEA